MSIHPETIRNVVLVGPTSSGKTILVENLLKAASALPRIGSISDGTTVSDFDDIEKRQGRSINLSAATFKYRDHHITLLDTPGYADFAGEVGAGLRAADAALFVVPAKAGFDGNTALLWKACDEVNMPRAIVISKCDAPESNPLERLQELQQQLGSTVVAFEIPTPSGVINLITYQVHDHSQGKHSARAATDEEIASVESFRTSLVEAILSEADDETLMEEYLNGESLDSRALTADVVAAVAHGHFFPVLFSQQTPEGFGSLEILDLIVDGFPSPLLHPIPQVIDLASNTSVDVQPDVSGELVAEVIKTTSDPYVGRISLVRVYSGELTLDKPLHVVGHFANSEMRSEHESDERIGSINHALGKALTPVTHAVAGEIVAITKLTVAETGDTLSDVAAPRLMPMWQVPLALHPVAIQAASKTDEDKVGAALRRLVTEDICVRVERNSITHQTVVWTLGDAHCEVVLHRLEHRYGLRTTTVPFRVPLLQTFAAATQAKGHLVKQSGGHGQYAICEIVVEPAERGFGFEFIDEVVGGAVPRNYIPSVEHGVSVLAQKGLNHDLPLVDFKVRLIDGKAHSVDSSDMAFQQAGALALTEASEKVGLVTLEPIDHVTAETDDAFVGAVLSDITSRRGRILSTIPESDGRTVIEAEIPQLELVSYASAMRSVSHGTGRFNRVFVKYEEMPAGIAAKYLASLD